MPSETLCTRLPCQGRQISTNPPRTPWRCTERVIYVYGKFCSAVGRKLYLQEMNPGEVITAEVVAIDQNFVTVNAGLKSESLIDVAEFKTLKAKLKLKSATSLPLPSNPSKTASSKPNCPAKKPNVQPIDCPGRSHGKRRHPVRHHQRKSQRRPDRYD